MHDAVYSDVRILCFTFCIFMFPSTVHRFASLLGKILSEMAVDGKTQYDISQFKRDREALTDPNFVPNFHLGPRLVTESKLWAWADVKLTAVWGMKSSLCFSLYDFRSRINRNAVIISYAHFLRGIQVMNVKFRTVRFNKSFGMASTLSPLPSIYAYDIHSNKNSAQCPNRDV